MRDGLNAAIALFPEDWVSVALRPSPLILCVVTRGVRVESLSCCSIERIVESSSVGSAQFPMNSAFCHLRLSSLSRDTDLKGLQ